MIMNIIAFLSDETGGLGQLGFGKSDTSIGSAALYALIGFLIVVAVLALLVGIFYLTGFIFKSKAFSRDKLFERKKKPKAASETSPAQSDDDELAAAITAAVMCMLESEGDDVKPDFVIRRITRKK